MTNVTIVRVGPDPFGRGELTVFYTDSSVGDGKEVFYLWAEHWRNHYPDVPIPPEGFNIEPPLPPRRSCVPYVLAPGHLERMSNMIQVWSKPK